MTATPLHTVVTTADAATLCELCFQQTNCVGGQLPPHLAIDALWTMSVDGYTDYTREQRETMRTAARMAEARLGETALEARYRAAEQAHARAEARLPRAVGSMGEDWFDETGE